LTTITNYVVILSSLASYGLFIKEKEMEIA